jgi:cell pole-organizing protein PopZ
MAEPSKDTDQSMEDILQSIKRIIADEGEPSPTMPGSDVLELTELLAEDAAPPAAPEPAPAAALRTAQDNIDALFASAPAVVEPEPEPEPVIAAPAPAPAPEPVVVAAAPAPISPSKAGDQLISDSTLAASVAALGALTNRQDHHPHSLDTPVFRSGSTVEDLVVEALKPMLKEWLDGNLPSIVRSLVEREIRRLGGH